MCITDKIQNIKDYIIQIDIDMEASLHYYKSMPNPIHIMSFGEIIDEIKSYNIPINLISLGSSKLLKYQQYN